MQAVARPSALPVLRGYTNGTLTDTASSPEIDTAPSPVEDRNRRAGSTPTRTIPAPGFFRQSVSRNSASTTAIPSAIHLSSLTNNNNNNKLKTQTSQTSISSARSARTSGTDSPKEGLSRRHSTRSSVVTSSSSGSTNGRNPTSNRSVVVTETSSSSGKPSATNTNKSNLARCSITRAIITKLQPNTSTKTKGIRR